LSIGTPTSRSRAACPAARHRRTRPARGVHGVDRHHRDDGARLAIAGSSTGAVTVAWPVSRARDIAARRTGSTEWSSPSSVSAVSSGST
jgi:hypothetical protein